MPVHMDAQQVWNAVLGDLQIRLPRNAFENWLRPTALIEFTDDVATVAAPNTFGASTLRARYAAPVERALSDVLGRPIQVRFTVVGAASESGAPRADSAAPSDRRLADESSASPGRASLLSERPPLVPTGRPVPSRSDRRAPPRRASAPTAPQRDASTTTATPPSPAQMELTATPKHGLNPRYIYENYVVGSSNRFAHAASVSIAEHPGGKFNPFFVYGGVGLGKTHLLHAVGHRALELNPNLSVVYVSSEKFTNDLIDSIRRQRMEEFRARYRTIDILMIDDIQFIAGKESTQEEFFHTFNALYQSGKQVIISSDKPPKAISALENRLRSRFEGGLIADVQLPDYEMRTAILRIKGEELGIDIPPDLIEYVAQKDQSNIRELEGAFNRILFHSQVTGRPLSLALAMEALTAAAPGARRRPTATADVVEAVVDYYGVTLRELRGRARTKEIVLPRQVAMYLLREETDASLVDIGQELGGRDHTTVLHGVEKVKNALATDTTLRAQVMAIREAIFTASD